jgi:HEAT repeat protein
MNRVRLLARPALCLAVLLLAGRPGDTADPPKIDLDELAPHPDLQWLRRAKVPTDDAGLAKFLAGLRGPEPDPAEVDRLVTQLRTGSKAEQDAAAAKLAEVGAIAVPVLRRRRLDADPAAAARVRACLAKIEEASDKPLARPAMRRLVRRQAPGAAEALLGYVPFAFDPEAELDAWYGLDELAAKDPKVLVVLAGALADKQPARRAVAACLLGRRGNASQKKAVAALLKDPDPVVRLRAAQGLLAGKDTAGVPTLIELLAHADAGVEVRWQAEELLRWLAVDTAPNAVVGAGDPKAAEACRAAWRKWWANQGQKADVAAAEREPRRPLLLLAYDRKGGRAWVVGCDGVSRHEWKLKPWLADAQYVAGGGIVTLHEQLAATKPVLAERGADGEALWQHTEMTDPRYCQRLSNGHVFVAEREKPLLLKLRYQVVAPGPRVVATQSASPSVATDAFRLTNEGRVACVSTYSPTGTTADANMIVEYDPATDTSRQWSCRYRLGQKLYLEFAPDGGYLLSALNERSPGKLPICVVECDYFGVPVWSYRLRAATHAYRLRGGTTIACSGNQFVELTADRRMVGEVTISSGPDVARPIMTLARFGFDQFSADSDLESDIDYRVQSLQRKDPQARLWALKQLAAFGPAAAGVIPKLRAHRDPDSGVDEALQKALLALGEKEIPRLTAESKQTDADRRFKAIADLREYAHSPMAVDALVAALSDENPKVRALAANGLGWQSRPDPQGRLSESAAPNPSAYAAERAVPALIKLIATDKDASARSRAIHALATFGEVGKRAGPLLINLVKDPRETTEVRCNAVTTLGRVANGDEAVLKVLHAALADTKVVSLQITAAHTLTTFPSPARDQVQRLLAAYPKRDGGENSPVNWFRSVVRSSVRRLQPDRPEVIALFLALAEDPSSTITERKEAAEFLFEVGKRETAAKFLNKWFAEEDRQQQSAVWDLAFQLRRKASISRWKDE